jgi:hypothetical protein
MEKYPRSIMEFEKQFSSEKNVVNISFNSDGQMGIDVPNVLAIKHGKLADICIIVANAALKLP